MVPVQLGPRKGEVGGSTKERKRGTVFQIPRVKKLISNKKGKGKDATDQFAWKTKT